MPLLRCDACPDGPVLHDGGDFDGALSAALQGVPKTAPVVIMVHGFKSSPLASRHNPHHHLFSLTPSARTRKALSWPLALGFGTDDPREGLCVAFAWPARGSLWQAWRVAQQAGAVLADLIARIAAHGRRVDLIAHSLGARVCLQAIAQSKGSPIGRVILLNAAEYRHTARVAASSPAGCYAEIFNVISRENDLYEALIEGLVRAPRPGDQTLGAGLSQPNWLDLQIDAPATLDALARLGVEVPEGHALPCHWSAYLRPGLMPFYARLLRDRERLSFPALRICLQREMDPRWARLRFPLPPVLRAARRLSRRRQQDPARLPAR